MLKYLIAVVIILFLVVGGLYAYFSRSIFIDFRPNAPITVTFRTEDDTFMHKNEDGIYVPILLRGVELSSSFPGHMLRDFGATTYDYIRWFGYIDAMGANTIYVQAVMDPNFYYALYRFNRTNDRPLFLLQGVAGYNYETLTYAMREAIGAVHGRRINLLGGAGLDMFLTNVSRWVVGYLVGAEWDPDMVTFKNHFDPYMLDYFEGEFFSSAYGASRFEVMLARVMDSAITYETRRHKAQRPIGFISNPAIDFLEYSEAYARQLRKYVQLDAENILPTDYMRAGTFAAYRLFYFADDFTRLLSDDQQAALAPILADLDRGCFADGYLDLLARYHTMPVIAAGFGFSSARAPHIMDRYPLNERQQGQAIANMVTQIEERGWAGTFITSWQDSWERRTWNTAFSSDPWRYHFWHNLQAADQGYGLMAFDPGRYERPVLIDGNADEWDASHLVHEYGGIRIYAQYSVQGVYLLIRGYGVNPHTTLYIPIDVTPNSGTYIFYDMEFARPSDFLLVLSGRDNSRLLVDRRYDATFMRFYEAMTGINPFTRVPPRWNSGFVPIIIAVQNTTIVDEDTFFSLVDTQDLLFLRYFETGRLTHGIGDPASPHFNSLTDFSFGENLVEVRLPWTLLNFFDPSSMHVHDDYYDHFGVERLRVQYIHIGIASENVEAPMSPIPLRGWSGWRDQVEFHERLKQSYFIMQELWANP